MPQFNSPYDPKEGPYIEVIVSKPSSLYSEDEVSQSKEKLRMLIDTGASKTAISTKVAQRMGLVPEGQREMTLASGTVMANLYYIDFEFGGVFPAVCLNTMEVVEFKLPTNNWRDGLIGRDFLEKITLEINAPSKTFKIVT